MSFVATAIVASTAVSFIGQQKAAKASEAQGRYNQQLAEAEAKQKELEDHENAKRARADKRKAMAQARARIAGAGGVVGEGSNADLMDSLDMRLETSIQDQSRRAWIASRDLRSQGQMAKWSGDQQATAYKIGSFGTLLDGGRQIASNFRESNYKTK